MKLKKLLAYIIITFVFFFILRILVSDIDSVSEDLHKIGFINIVFSSGLYLFYFYSRAFSWGYFLDSVKKTNVSKEEKLYTWFLGESTRYIPGNIWSFVGRFYLTSKRGIPKIQVAISITIEIVSMVFVAFVISIPELLKNFERLQISGMKLLFPLLFILLISICIWILLRMDKYFEKSKINIKNIIKDGNFKRGILFQFYAWIFFGLAAYVLIRPISPNLNIFTIISLSVLSWLLGYLSLLTPMGLGVREGIWTILLSTLILPTHAGLIVILSRIILILCEMANLTVWLFAKQRDKLSEIFRKFYGNWAIILVFIFSFIYIVTMTWFSVLKHRSFASNYDLANMSQTMWNSINGRVFTLSAYGESVSRFSIHADPILILISPLYLIWPNVLIVLFFQSLVLGLGAFPVYFLTKKIFSEINGLNFNIIKIISLSFVILYLVNPWMMWANIYDFHPVTISITFLISSIYFALNKKWKLYFLFIFLAITTKEEISLIIFLIGLYVFFIQKARKIGLITSIFGISWFYFMVFKVIPFYSIKSEHWGINTLYYIFIQKFSEVKNLSMFLDLFNGYFLIPRSIEYYVLLLKSMSFLPLLGFPWLIFALPELFINLLSADSQMQGLTLHYQSGLLPFLIISSIFGSFYIFKIINKIKILNKYISFLGIFFSILIVFVSLRVNYHYGPLPTTPSCWCLFYNVTNDDEQFEIELKRIPKNASVSSSGEISPHVSMRKNSYVLPGSFETVDYVALIDQNRILGDYNKKEFEISLLKNKDFLKKHNLISHIGHFYLFAKK